MEKQLELHNQVQKISFHVGKPPHTEEIMKIEKGKFFWKGEEVEDRYEVYERFNEWLTLSEKERKQ